MLQRSEERDIERLDEVRGMRNEEEGHDAVLECVLKKLEGFVRPMSVKDQQPPLVGVVPDAEDREGGPEETGQVNNPVTRVKKKGGIWTHYLRLSRSKNLSHSRLSLLSVYPLVELPFSAPGMSSSGPTGSQPSK